MYANLLMKKCQTGDRRRPAIKENSGRSRRLSPRSSRGLGSLWSVGNGKNTFRVATEISGVPIEWIDGICRLAGQSSDGAAPAQQISKLCSSRKRSRKWMSCAKQYSYT
jgi:hypothetical protein